MEKFSIERNILCFVQDRTPHIYQIERQKNQFLYIFFVFVPNIYGFVPSRLLF